MATSMSGSVPTGRDRVYKPMVRVTSSRGFAMHDLSGPETGTRPVLLGVELVPVHVGLTQVEPQLLVQTVSGFARRARGQVHRLRPLSLGMVQRGPGQRRPDAFAAAGLVGDDVLDERPDPRGNAEH